MIFIIAIIIICVVAIVVDSWKLISDGGITIGSIIVLVPTLIFWGVLTMFNLTCESLGESYQEETRFDWLTGCMLPLEDGREVQIDEDSIALVVRELVEDAE